MESSLVQSLVVRARLRWSVIILTAILFGTVAAVAQQAPREDAQEELRKRDLEYNRSLERPKAEENEEDVRGRDEWFNFQRRFPFDAIPAGARVEAIRQTRAMEEKLHEALAKNRGNRTLAANRWEDIGPNNVAGRIPALAYHPTEPGVLLIGGASGGVWKSTDNGKSWSTTFDKQTALTIGAIAYDYTDPNTIYAGSGENYSASEDYYGDGIFKSTDGGETWRNMGLNSVGGFSKIFVHRQNHSIVYAATAKGGGFYRSTDGGATWTRTLATDCLDMSVNPKNSQELMITTGGGISRSTDGGLTFTSINSGLNLSGVSRISVSMSPGDPKRAYALVARYPGQNGYNSAELYSSNDGGSTWQLKQNLGGPFFRNQGYYDNFLEASPASPDKMVMGGIDIFATTDGASTNINTTDVYGSNPQGVHPDQHVVAFNPRDPNELLVGNDGGLYRSYDGGNSWERVSTNLPITQFYKMDVDFANVDRVYGGTQDNGTNASLSDGANAKNWLQISGGDGFYVAADPVTPGVVYSEIYYGTPIYRVETSHPADAVPIDNDISFEKGDWSSPLIFSQVTGYLYSGRRHLFRTPDGGVNWETLSPGNSSFISAIGPSMLEEDKLVIGSAGGELRYSTNDGATWARGTGIPSRFISDVRFDPVKPDRVYAVVSGFGTGHVFRSESYGATFSDISANLPNAPVNCIAIDPRDNTHLFVGTDAGAFVSLDGGGTWLPFNEGLPLAPVVDLKIHDATRTLIAATHGRSMFRIKIDAVEPSPVMITPVGGESFVSPLDLPVRWLGLTPPVRVWVSYDNGKNFTKVADNVTSNDVTLPVPVVKTDVAIVKVEEVNGGRSIESGNFSLSAATNGSEIAKRGFVAEAIEPRRGYLWATERGSDSLYKLKLPLLSAREGLVRTNIPGRVRDMAYDSSSDRFYLLVTADDFSGAKLYAMDSTGTGLGQIPLPEGLTSAVGVSMLHGNLALMTPGADGEIFLIDTAGTLITRSGALQGPAAADRRSLAWDGSGLLQGVVSGSVDDWFPSRLERVHVTATPSVSMAMPVILQNTQRLEFYGLAVDFTSATNGKQTIWGTDTAGSFYKFVTDPSGVVDLPMTGARASEIALTAITPNPFRSGTRVDFTLRSGREVTLDLYRASGERVLRIFSGRREAGENSVALAADGLASGIYYVVLGDAGGERDVRPVVLVK
jgi:photosystem II stability/assembly factor-like uncharacterized protein